MAELQFCNASGLLAPRLEAEVRAGIWDAVTALLRTPICRMSASSCI